MNRFTQLELNRHTLDIYYARTSIFRAVDDASNDMSGTLLDIGCGKMPYREHIMAKSKLSSYVGLDIDAALQYDAKVKPDFFWDGSRMPFEENQFECAMATEVLEHCPDPRIVLSESFRVLKPGGFIFCTIPFLWPLHEVPYDEFRYTPFAMERFLKDAGFINVDIRATGGWHAAMAQMLGLWVKRAPLPTRFKKIAPWFILPVYKKLLKIDSIPEKFYEGTMITGIKLKAYKPVA
jgi:SAM-dependent methyltransferase